MEWVHPLNSILCESVQKVIGINVWRGMNPPFGAAGRCEQIFTPKTRKSTKIAIERRHTAPQAVLVCILSPYVPYVSPPAQAAGRHPAPPERLHNDSHQADPTRPAPKNTAHERYRRRPPWPQACARVASAATAMAGGYCGRCGCHLLPVRTTGGICRAGRELEGGQERQA